MGKANRRDNEAQAPLLGSACFSGSASPEDRFAAFIDGGSALDGHAYVGVASTRIYCRPTCRVATAPKPGNCSYFETRAAAEAAGYRPCKLCRPENAPTVKNAGETFADVDRAAVVLRALYSRPGAAADVLAFAGIDADAIADAFEAAQGACADDYLLTFRLLGAKALLTDSRVPVADVARAVGFADEAQLREALRERYRFEPEDFRRRPVSAANAEKAGIAFYVGYRAPFDFEKLLAFFRYRQLNGVELIDEKSYSRTVRMPNPAQPDEELLGWVRVENDAAHNRLACRMSASLLPAYSRVVARVHHVFDTDCDPERVHAALHSLDGVVPGSNVLGTRVPGAFDAFEIAVRAVLGQQVSVLAANKMAERIALAHGMPIDTGIPGLDRVFPSRDDFLALDPIEDALGVHGVIKTRSRTIYALATLNAAHDLDLTLAGVPAETLECLLAVKGIGPWSANYICMRTLGYTDAFLETDAGIKHALPELTPKERLAAADAWRPWRSYANVSLWNSLS